jgi:CubicO group peptidase (beta-lactamase class C family)
MNLRTEHRATQQKRSAVEGTVAGGFEPVGEAFQANFDRGDEVAGAVAVYHRDQPLVDLWGGVADATSGKPWEHDTLVPVYSCSKGVVAIAANMLADRGLIDLDAPVARYWPAFGSVGKEAIPVRWLLTHQAGLAAVDRPLSYQEFLSWDPVIRRLEEQRPNWEPGTAHGYHSLTFGFLVGEVIRRVTGLTPGQWIARHIAGPLEADFYIGLPPGLVDQVAIVLPPRPNPGGTTTLRTEPGSLPMRAIAFVRPPPTPLSVNDPALRAAEVPSANGIGTARGLAKIFAAVIGSVEGISLMSHSAMERARTEQVRGPDIAGLGMEESTIGLGLQLPTGSLPLGGPGSFGTTGLGGSQAWALPEADLVFSYVTNQPLDEKPDHRALAPPRLRCAAWAPMLGPVPPRLQLERSRHEARCHNDRRPARRADHLWRC